MNDTPQSPPIKGLGKLIHISGWAILFCSLFLHGKGVAGHVRGVSAEHHRAAFFHARLLLELWVASEEVFVQPPDRAFPVDQPIAYREYDAVRVFLHALFLPSGDASFDSSAPPIERDGGVLCGQCRYLLLSSRP